MTKLSYKERERQRREKEILWVAARLIHERGYAQLNMDEVAEEVGVSKPTLYQHFSSKDEMVLGTMIESAEQLVAHIRALKDRNPVEQLEQTLRYLLKSHYSPDDYPATFVHEPSLMAHDAYQRVIKHRAEVGKLLHDMVKSAQEQGYVAANIPPLVIISGMFSVLGILRGPEMMHDYSHSIEEIVEGIVQMFLHGITTD